MYTVVYTNFSLLKNEKAIHPLNELGGLLATKRIKVVHGKYYIQKIYWWE